MLLTSICIDTHSQNDKMDTLFIGQHEPTFYYWDTNWWDYYHLNYPPCDDLMKKLPFSCNYNCPENKVEIARYCYTDKPLKVIGVAAPVAFDIPVLDNGQPYVVDTVIAHRLPEYFRLYDVDDSLPPSQMVMAREARWDNFQPRYVMPVQRMVSEVEHNDGTYHFEWQPPQYEAVYEAYFTPVVVYDSFYVSATGNNNYFVEHYGLREHPATRYFLTQPYNSICPIQQPVFHTTEHYKMYAHLYNDVNPRYMDTTQWFYQFAAPDHGIYGQFLNIFPIFDTSYNGPYIINDTCLAPANFRILDITGHNVTFAWEQTTGGRWELSIVPEGQDCDNSPVTTHFVTFATVSDLDTTQWYEARIRSLCDSSISAWSDSIRFCVGSCSDNRIETTADRYTYLMPNPASETVTVASSFRIGDVEVYTLDGRRILASRVDGISTTLDISSLPTGTYIVRISTNNGTAFKKLVVK
ncbi:MAG: T9SS type A sorting domain-containing protein [Bacteroidales bacterium]|nr:T9SS type A sorting domain-containing protein [Bacteroidales bacterium]